MQLAVTGFESSKTVQVRIYNVTTATEVVAWTATGVTERADGEGYSTYYYDYAIVSGNEYIVDWKDNSSPVRTASEGISAKQSGVALDSTVAKEATLAALQADIGDPSVDITSIYAQLLLVKGYVDTLEAALATHEANRVAMQATLIAEHDATQALIAASSGDGANQVIIQAEITGGSTPIVGVSVQVFNSGQTLVLARGVTDTNGQTTLALNDGTYKVRLYKAGYTFTVPETVVVSGNGTFILDGAVVEIGVPSSANTCRVYEWCFGPDDTTPLVTVTAEAKIVGLPYDFNTKLHARSVVTKVYDANTGKLYWDIVYGASVAFSIEELGVIYTRTVPALTTKRLSEMT